MSKLCSSTLDQKYFKISDFYLLYYKKCIKISGCISHCIFTLCINTTPCLKILPLNSSVFFIHFLHSISSNTWAFTRKALCCSTACLTSKASSLYQDCVCTLAEGLHSVRNHFCNCQLTGTPWCCSCRASCDQ